jgi:hypothetical protein
MFEILVTGLVIVVVGIVCLLAASVFMAYITQAEYIDDHQFGDNDDD